MKVNDLNNKAIALFQRGFHKDAVVCLKAAIDLLLGDLRSQATTSSTPTSSERIKPCGISSQQSQVMKAFMSPVPIENARDDYAARTMYNSAVLLPNNLEDLMSTDDSYVDDTSVVLLYNLAFINHWRAVHLGLSKDLPKALKLYKMAIEIISESRSTNILLCAIWNNMGHIHIQLFHLDEARACFSRLWLVLEHRADIREQLSLCDFNNFLLSAMSQAGELHLAPAA
jgi:tetratricopeptide (TPR) repeat protein